MFRVHYIEDKCYISDGIRVRLLDTTLPWSTKNWWISCKPGIQRRGGIARHVSPMTWQDLRDWWGYDIQDF